MKTRLNKILPFLRVLLIAVIAIVLFHFITNKYCQTDHFRLWAMSEGFKDMDKEQLKKFEEGAEFFLSILTLKKQVNCADSCQAVASDSDQVPLSRAQRSVQLFGRFQNTMNHYLRNSTDTNDQHIHNLFLSKMPHAFFLPRKGIEAIANDSFYCQECPQVSNNDSIKASGARVYFGTTPRGVHLYMLPVFATGSDTIDVIPRDTNSSSFVYNFITPCPNYCDNSNNSESLEEAHQCGKRQDRWKLDTLISNPCIACSDAPPCTDLQK